MQSRKVAFTGREGAFESAKAEFTKRENKALAYWMAKSTYAAKGLRSLIHEQNAFAITCLTGQIN